MNITYALAVVSLAVALDVTGHAQRPTGNTDALVQGNTAFALDLYGQLAKAKGNLFFSPYSISTGLALTYDGAKNKTAAQMKTVLHFPFDPPALNPAFADLRHRLLDQESKGKYRLVTANRLFGQKDFGFRPSFLKDQRDFYDAPLQEVDFVGATDAARHTINAWVEQQTNDKIKDLIQPGVLNSASRLVLANAIYFKAAWKQPFNDKLTAREKFQVDAQNAITVPTMHANKRARFFKGDAFRALELPYEGNELAMVVFLPEKTDGLAALEKQLTRANLQAWLGKLSDHQVNIAMPRFTLTNEFYLNKVLAALGMTDAFSDAADFSGITSDARLSISAALHKAFIDVNERGTEAAASTAIAIGLTSAPPGAVFHADHPFVYLIRHNRTGAVLFMGRVVNPG